jgi:hypothetical protein
MTKMIAELQRKVNRVNTLPAVVLLLRPSPTLPDVATLLTRRLRSVLFRYSEREAHG